ncbi:hypothetical protein [Salinispora arenicola]|uniref:Uncharacterized protein n=1 Tax=Salinispora arenicola (strain CNS-205) TaxID=391037 RepID=A8M5Y9_SALAI|nr:hypothetical protein [Salinispora arenicola]MCN0178496.1 hypothetical protein [Salinispora arenicola]
MVFDLRVRLGAMLRIEAADRYRPADGPVMLRVTGVRLVLNRPERDQRIWVEGTKVTPPTSEANARKPSCRPGCSRRRKRPGDHVPVGGGAGSVAGSAVAA